MRCAAAALVTALAVLAPGQRPVSTQEPKPATTESADLPLHLVKLPPGFRIEIYATGVPVARQMALGSKGTLVVGTRNKNSGGAVYAVVDRNGDQKADQVFTIAKGLNEPSGVAFREGALYVA